MQSLKWSPPERQNRLGVTGTSEKEGHGSSVSEDEMCWR